MILTYNEFFVCLKLAGSDANKNAIVQKGGLDRLMKLSSRFSEDPSVLQEVLFYCCLLKTHQFK